jgi:hypothetical protein
MSAIKADNFRMCLLITPLTTIISICWSQKKYKVSILQQKAGLRVVYNTLGLEFASHPVPIPLCITARLCGGFLLVRSASAGSVNDQNGTTKVVKSIVRFFIKLFLSGFPGD